MWWNKIQTRFFKMKVNVVSWTINCGVCSPFCTWGCVQKGILPATDFNENTVLTDNTHYLSQAIGFTINSNSLWIVFWCDHALSRAVHFNSGSPSFGSTLSMCTGTHIFACQKCPCDNRASVSVCPWGRLWWLYVCLLSDVVSVSWCIWVV